MTSLAHAIWLDASYMIYAMANVMDGPIMSPEDWATSPLVALMWKDACR